MTGFNISIKLACVVLATVLLAGCEVPEKNSGYQTFGTQPYPEDLKHGDGGEGGGGGHSH